MRREKTSVDTVASLLHHDAMPTTKRPTKKRKPRRTSDRVASRAGRLLDMCDEGSFLFRSDETAGMLYGGRDVTELVSSIAASCLVQREHRGPRGTKGRK